jgi:acetyl-CoA carboxylase/biotin carboxylase 1
VEIPLELCLDSIPEEMYRKACVTTADEAVASCQMIGYPAMIKASWGGGGKGIRKVHYSFGCTVLKRFCYYVCSVRPNLFNILTRYLLQVNNDDEVKALFKQVQGEVPGSPIFIMRLASQVRLVLNFYFPRMLFLGGILYTWKLHLLFLAG